MVERPSILFGVVVRRVTAIQKPQTLDDGELFGTRVGRAFLEPAQRAGAGAAEDDATIPGLLENRVNALRPPDGLLIQRVAA